MLEKCERKGRKMKRLVSVFLALVFGMISGTTAFANTNAINYEVECAGTTVQIEITEDGYVRTRADYGDYYEIATREIDSYIVVVEKYNLDNSLISKEVCDFNTEQNESQPYNAIGEFVSTISGYNYEVEAGGNGRYEIWTCTRRDDVKNRSLHDPEGTTAARCYNWRRYVKDIYDQEVELGTQTTPNLLSKALTAFFTNGILAATNILAESVDVIDDFTSLTEMLEEADAVFERI